MERHVTAFARKVGDWLSGEVDTPIYEVVDFGRYGNEVRELGAVVTARPALAAAPAPAGSPEAVVFATSFIRTLACLHRRQDWTRALDWCVAATQSFSKLYLAAFEEEDTLDAARAADVLLQKSLALAKAVGRTAVLDEGLHHVMSAYLRMRMRKGASYDYDRQAGLMLMQVFTVRLACQCYVKRYSSALSHVIKPCEEKSARLADLVPTPQEAAAGRADPAKEWIPASVWVTFCFYYGLVSLFAEDLHKAHTLLTMALKLCHKDARANVRRIAFFLVPLNLRRLQYPPLGLLHRTGLLELYGPIMLFVAKGDLQGFRAFMDRRRLTILRLQLTCLLQPLETVLFANLCRRLVKTSATHDGQLLALEDIVAAAGGAITELEAEGMLAALKASGLKLLGGYLVSHGGKNCFQFDKAPDQRVRKTVQNFGRVTK